MENVETIKSCFKRVAKVEVTIIFIANSRQYLQVIKNINTLLSAYVSVQAYIAYFNSFFVILNEKKENENGGMQKKKKKKKKKKKTKAKKKKNK